jgi:CSLREA domain-containing protein
VRFGYRGLVAAVVTVLAVPASAGAATITPSTLGDDNTGNGNCTLREAIIAANTDAAVDACAPGSGSDVIQLSAGTYALSVPGTLEDAGATGDLDITAELRIVGAPEGSTVNANGIDRVFHVLATSAVFDLLTIAGGDAPGTDDGGGILVDDNSTAAVNDSTVRNNSAGSGGGIEADENATANVTRSLLVNNSTTSDDGAGIDADTDGASISVDSSTVSGNTAFQQGGGVNVEDGGDGSVVNSTISGNTAIGDPNDGFGGGVRLFGGTGTSTLTVASSTISENTADVGGGMYHEDDGTLNVKGTIVSGNIAPTGPDCGGPNPTTSLGHNLFQDLTGCTFAGTGTDNTGVNPQLGPLADNGGPTQTHALNAGSPAIDAGPSDAPPVDQRGAPRNQPDIGAYELVTCLGATVNRVGTGGDDTLTGTDGDDAFLLGAGNDTASGGVGNDLLCGEAGNDTLNGDAGNDNLDGDAGNDSASGGEGDDTATGGDGDDAFDGGAGNDTADGGVGNDNLKGSDGNDLLLGADGNDRASGGNGKDKAKGGNGKDRLKGGKGKDRLNGGKGKDRLNGGQAKDTCNGGKSRDRGKGCEKERKIP